MRIPLGKVYRAFKELDQFDDQQCEWYIRRAKWKHIVSMILVGIVAVGAVLLFIVLALLIEGWLLTSVQNTAFAMSFQSSVMSVVAALAGVLVPVAIGLVIGLMIRDVWLRWAVRKELAQTRCLRCDYQLIGLPVHSGVVRCPECGMDNKLYVQVPAAPQGVTATIVAERVTGP